MVLKVVHTVKVNDFWITLTLFCLLFSFFPTFFFFKYKQVKKKTVQKFLVFLIKDELIQKILISNAVLLFKFSRPFFSKEFSLF